MINQAWFNGLTHGSAGLDGRCSRPFQLFMTVTEEGSLKRGTFFACRVSHKGNGSNHRVASASHV